MAYLMTDFAAGAGAVQSVLDLPLERQQKEQQVELNKLVIQENQMKVGQQQRANQLQNIMADKLAASQPLTSEQVDTQTAPSRVQQTRTLADQQRQLANMYRGFAPDTATKYDEEARKLDKDADSIEDRVGKNTKENFENVGRIANAFLQSKDWNRAINDVAQFDTKAALEMSKITDPAQQEKLALYYAGRSETFKQAQDMQFKQQQEVRRQESAKAREKHTQFQETMTERRQTYLERKATAEERQADSKLGQKYRDSAIKATTSELDSLNKQLREIDSRYATLSNAMYAPYEGEDVKKELEDLKAQREDLTFEVKRVQGELSKLGAGARAGGGSEVKPEAKPAFNKNSTYKFAPNISAATIKSYKEAMQDAANDPERRLKIQQYAYENGVVVSR